MIKGNSALDFINDDVPTGIMLCGHGSRSKSAVAEFANLAEELKKTFHPLPVEYGYLEFAHPVIREGLDRLKDKGAKRILAVPGMLFAAGHAKNDIPSVLNKYASEHKIEIKYGRELAVDLRMLKAAAARVQEAQEIANQKYGKMKNEETVLVVIGRGSSDPDANSNVAKIARMLWEGMGFGWCETGYSGVTFPLVAPCLEHVARLGYKRVIVFPYFLFSGILIDRIYGFSDKIQAEYPDIQFINAGYLNAHPEVVATMADRVRETMTGNNNMNCSLCKYRAQALGFEHEVGAVQSSHHHHVEGQGVSAPGSNVEDCKLCDDFCTGICRLEQTHHHDHTHHHSHDHNHEHAHHHDHSHAPYPHAQHPLGPESARKYQKTKAQKS